MTIAVPEIIPIVPRRLRLRWRFDYADRPTKKGVWNGASQVETDQAWRQPKDGMIRAVIEGENLITAEEVTMVEVAGQDYAFAQWEVNSPCAPFAVNGSQRLGVRLHGLSFYTRDERITAFVDGSVSRRPLTEDERRFDFYEHNAGT